MQLFKLLMLTCLLTLLISCGSDDKVEVEDLPDIFWNIQLDGEDFSLPNSGPSAYYSSGNGDLTIVGTKSNSTEERIVFTFSVADGAPFVNGETLDMSEGSNNAILYVDPQNNDYSSVFLEGNGTFTVDEYIETDSRDFLSGTVSGVLFNKVDNTSMTISGSVGGLTL